MRARRPRSHEVRSQERIRLPAGEQRIKRSAVSSCRRGPAGAARGGTPVVYFCRNHPTTQTNTLCARCAQPFCGACMVEILGQRYCAPCRDVRLQELQGIGPGQQVGGRLAGTGIVDLGGWIGDGWGLIQNDILTFAVATFLMMLLSSLTCGILLGPMMCGLHMMVYRKMTYGRVEIGHLFDGFRRAGWGILGAVLLGLMFGACYLIAWAPVIALAAASPSSSGPDAMVGLLLLLLMYVVYPLLMTLVGWVTFFMFPYIAARNANPVEGLAASWEVVRRNPLMFVLASFIIHLHHPPARRTRGHRLRHRHAVHHAIHVRRRFEGLRRPLRPHRLGPDLKQPWNPSASPSPA
jgi:hypothetical protein